MADFLPADSSISSLSGSGSTAKAYYFDPEIPIEGINLFTADTFTLAALARDNYFNLNTEEFDTYKNDPYKSIVLVNRETSANQSYYQVYMDTSWITVSTSTIDFESQFIKLTDKAVANGVATLGSTGKLVPTQLDIASESDIENGTANKVVDAAKLKIALDSSPIAEVELIASALKTSDVEAIRESNKNLYAASGVAEWGTRGSTPVNTLKDGLNCTTTAYTLLHDGKYHIAGLIFDIPDNSPVNFDAAPDGKTTYHRTTGVVTKHATVQAAFAAANADVNVEVVTDRTDVYALEIYLRDITEADPMVYPHGYIHSQDSDINGVTASLNTIRPDSYYAHYTGQTDVIRGRSVNWFTATNDEKLAILSVADKHGYIHYDPKNSVWRQWCIRVRDRVGDGNGDWAYIDSTNSYTTVRYKVLASNVFLPQGIRDTPLGTASVNTSAYTPTFGNMPFTIAQPVNGCYHLGKASPSGSDSVLYEISQAGEAYLLVLGTVARLSNSVWHPSHNPMGCYKYTAANLNPLGQGITSKEQCFLPENIGTQSARPDGRLPNLIYASGYSGVCRDMRYSAHHTTKEESDLQKFNACNGTYRGFEKRVRTKVIKTSPVDGEPLKIWHAQHEILYIGSDNFIPATQENLEHLNLSDSFPNWYEISVYNVTRNILVKTKKQLFLFNTYIYINQFSWETLGFRNGDIIELTVTRELSQSIGGEFYHCDLLLGENIDVTTHPDFKNGWEGKLIDAKIDGTTKDFNFNRLSLLSSAYYTQSLNGGVWNHFGISSLSLQYNGFVNTRVGNSVDIELWSYPVNAHNTTMSVLNPINHIDDTVFISSDFTRTGFSSIASSLLNIHLKSDGGVHTQQPKLLNTLIDPNTYKFGTGSNIVPISHSPLELSVAVHDSSAIKLLTYSSESNSQVTLNFAATELKYTPITVHALTEAQTFQGVYQEIGTVFRVTDGTRFIGRTFIVSMHNTTPLSDAGFYLDPTGDVRHPAQPNAIYAEPYVIDDSKGWGDDNQIHIVDNESSLIDENGNTVKVVTHTLAEPLGWVK